MTKNNRDQDVEFIKALAELLRENDLNELEVSREYGEDDSLNVRVARGGVVAAPVMAAAPVAPHLRQCQLQRPPRQRPQQRQVMIQHPIQVRFHRPWSVPSTCKPNQAHLRSFPLAPAFQRVIPC